MTEITNQSSDETNANPEMIESRPRFQAHPVQLATLLTPPSNILPLRPTSVPHPLNTHLFGDQQAINNLRQKPPEALIGIIYQSKLHYQQQDREFKTRISQIETSHKQHVTQLLGQLRNVMQTNVELRRQLNTGTDHENALAAELQEVKEHNTYQKSLLDYRQSILDRVEGLIAESQRTEERLREELKNSKNEVTDLQTKLQEREDELVQLRLERTAEIKIQRDIGVAVSVQIVDDGGTISLGSVSSLTPALLEQIKRVKQKFSKRSKFKISNIEYIFNSKLFNEFDMARNELERNGRPSGEEILFHGTPPRNINEYHLPLKTISNDSIITGGFLIGGVDGHRSYNGAAYVLPL